MTYEQFFKDGITETQQQVGFKIDKQLVLSFLRPKHNSKLGFKIDKQRDLSFLRASRVRTGRGWWWSERLFWFREWVGATIGEGPDTTHAIPVVHSSKVLLNKTSTTEGEGTGYGPVICHFLVKEVRWGSVT
jgi:hypothetical protein